MTTIYTSREINVKCPLWLVRYAEFHPALTLGLQTFLSFRAVKISNFSPWQAFTHNSKLGLSSPLILISPRVSVFSQLLTPRYCVLDVHLLVHNVWRHFAVFGHEQPVLSAVALAQMKKDKDCFHSSAWILSFRRLCIIASLLLLIYYQREFGFVVWKIWHLDFLYT